MDRFPASALIHLLLIAPVALFAWKGHAFRINPVGGPCIGRVERVTQPVIPARVEAIKWDQQAHTVREHLKRMSQVGGEIPFRSPRFGMTMAYRRAGDPEVYDGQLRFPVLNRDLNGQTQMRMAVYDPRVVSLEDADALLSVNGKDLPFRLESPIPDFSKVELNGPSRDVFERQEEPDVQISSAVQPDGSLQHTSNYGDTMLIQDAHRAKAAPPADATAGTGPVKPAAKTRAKEPLFGLMTLSGEPGPAFAYPGLVPLADFRAPTAAASVPIAPLSTPDQTFLNNMLQQQIWRPGQEFGVQQFLQSLNLAPSLTDVRFQGKPADVVASLREKFGPDYLQALLGKKEEPTKPPHIQFVLEPMHARKPVSPMEQSLRATPVFGDQLEDYRKTVGFSPDAWATGQMKRPDHVPFWGPATEPVQIKFGWTNDGNTWVGLRAPGSESAPIAGRVMGVRRDDKDYVYDVHFGSGERQEIRWQPAGS
jgi:hypothetical protein